MTFTKNSISSNPGSYKIWIESSTGSTPWVIIHKTSASSAVSVEIVSGATCNTPTGINHSNVTSNSAQINWTQNSSNTQNIVLEHRQVGSPAWVVNTLDANYHYYNLTGLIASTSYEYRLKRICNSGGSSPYSNIGSFTTITGIVNNGIYKLTRQGTNKVLDAAYCGGAGANVQLWDDLNNDCQKWVFEYQPVDGSYEIKAKYNIGLNLDVYYCGGAGANVQIMNDFSNICQRWVLEVQSDGSYEIKSKNNTNLNLDAQDCGNWAGTNVQLWTDNSLNCQRWILTFLGTNVAGDETGNREEDTPIVDAQKPEFKISPNPTSGLVRLEFAEDMPIGKATVQVYDLAGKLIETLFSGDADDLDSEIQYDAGNLHSGTYLVVLTHEHGREIKRMVVAR
ncbi:MAG: RICIN domain-containing protein [Saprospiraceae bacterium]|nr:RICIN domain-containing protein [Saprospiraceae bacterium]